MSAKRKTEPKQKWLERRDRRLRLLESRKGPYLFWDRIYESWIVVKDGCFIPERDKDEAFKRLMA